MYVPKVEIFGCVFVSFLFISPVLARHKHHHNIVCEGDRQEGDKWFDGCKWCVCQRSGPLCSPARCSDLTRHVPPCSRLGSRWRDGCYDCRCHGHGIECHADRACVVLMETESYQRQVMTPGACVEPKDDRCVCGVDGVPSCTVEVIDRDAHPATTIAFDLALPYTTDFASSVMASPYVRDFGARNRERKPPHESFDAVEVPARRSRSNHRKSKNTEVSPKQAHSFTAGVRRSLRKFSEDFLHLSRDMGKYDNAYKTREYYDLNRHRTKSSRYKRNTERKWRLARVRNSKGQLVHVPGSLLVITDNRCRYGVRWYGGSLRCFCDEEGSVTCGDPSFVASRIDGFRLEKLPCEEGHAWEEYGSCQVCHCQISGVVLCQRSESCPLPFLIRPVQYGDEFYESTDEFTNKDRTDEKVTKRHPRRPKDIDVNLDTKNRNGTNTNRNVIKVDRLPGPKLPSTEDNLPKGDRQRNIYGTTVLVRECKPYSRWLDGCKRCFCDSKGRKQCNERHCLKPRLPSEVDQPIPHSIKDKISGRPFQRPPTVTVVREGPVSIKPVFTKSSSCGRHKERQVYWVKCNLCVCTSGGPRCTAKSCG